MYKWKTPVASSVPITPNWTSQALSLAMAHSVSVHVASYLPVMHLLVLNMLTQLWLTGSAMATNEDEYMVLFQDRQTDGCIIGEASMQSVP